MPSGSAGETLLLPPAHSLTHSLGGAFYRLLGGFVLLIFKQRHTSGGACSNLRGLMDALKRA
jgi:hypothetical protein